MELDNNNRTALREDPGKRPFWAGVIVRVLIGGLLFFFLLVQLSYIHRGYDRMMRFYGLPKQSLDAVVVGTSSTFTSYMPMEVWNEDGIASAVAATNMQFEGTLVHTIREIRKYQTPKVWIIDLMPFIRGHYAGQEAWNGGDRNLNIRYNVDSMRWSKNRMDLIHEICSDYGLGLRDEIYYNFDLARYHMTKAELSRFGNAVRDLNYGYQHLQREGGEPFDVSVMTEGTEKETPLEGTERKNLDGLLSEAALLKQSGAEVVFLFQPFWFETEEEAGRKTWLCRILSEQGFRFWDLTLEKEAAGLIPDEDFRDFLHFDSLGSMKSTRLISSHLKQDFSLPDHRQDPAYASWNADYPQWAELRGGYLNVDTAAAAADKEKEEGR